MSSRLILTSLNPGYSLITNVFNLHKLIGLNNDSYLSKLIIELYRHKRLDKLFNDGDLSVLDNVDVFRIFLGGEFVEFVKKAMEF